MWKLLRLSLVPFFIFAYEGFHSLKIEVGARESAMGGTGVSHALAPFSAYWNPALIVWNPSQIQFFHYSCFASTRLQGFCVNRKIFEKASFSISLLHFGGGKIELRDEIVSENPKGYYDFHDIVIGIGGAGKISSDASWGINLKYYFEKIWRYEGNGVGFDAGIKFKPFKFLDAGFSISNFGTTIRVKNDLYNLPTLARLGISLSYKIKGYKIIFSSSLDYRFYSKGVLVEDRTVPDPLKVGNGIELNYKFISLRAGIKLADNNYYAVGIGIKEKWISIDYSYSLYQFSIGGIHRIDLTFF